MSAIAGIVSSDVIPQKKLTQSMLLTMAHRSSNTIQDVIDFQNAQIGSLGRKVVSNEKKTIFLSFDGIITNKKELTDELNKSVPVDEELIVLAFEQWGS